MSFFKQDLKLFINRLTHLHESFIIVLENHGRSMYYNSLRYMRYTYYYPIYDFNSIGRSIFVYVAIYSWHLSVNATHIIYL